uniref:Fe2OG dioxygenase domain-containing protein n=1 Tax=Chromera velia CCMP2878 TaxID=1169474 RepID=A0A0G4FLI4_9ALVE|eukprot:Cvel_3453.t1-p1 / transcript=Cvel_3453.t1 / gene=Cvel_3453 / organism=Chromera_velia_CCMP2878 / gene_product=Putative prolyl 4-hydroxylase, putative / transcript_product=Putative prolyl 4-hydroxylase, putative / location=Cvel_scaffold139:42840-45163(-) / protein_length=357 / sequence_SO=supercontig / SO=protein_coding / is_pseudo=false
MTTTFRHPQWHPHGFHPPVYPTALPPYPQAPLYSAHLLSHHGKSSSTADSKAPPVALQPGVVSPPRPPYGMHPQQLPWGWRSVVPAGYMHPGPPVRTPENRGGQPSTEGKTAERESQVLSKEPKVILYPNFLTDEECAHLQELAEGRYQRSKTGRGGVSSSVDNYSHQKSENRTSESCQLLIGQTQLSAAIEAKITKLAGCPEGHLEPLMVVRYRPGEFFKTHHDGYFRPSTVLLYLNDDFEEGGTQFEELGLSVSPQKGAAVVWSNSHFRPFSTPEVQSMGEKEREQLLTVQRADGSFKYGKYEPDWRMMHAGLPPSRGEKYVVNAFINQQNMVEGVEDALLGPFAPTSRVSGGSA